MDNVFRLAKNDPALEEQEKLWWETFADIENRFCWVQTKREQDLLRRRYVKQIVSFSKKDQPIVELGCGVGWLSIMLAEAGAKDVYGLDFSQAQIVIANQQLQATKVRDQVTFIHSSSDEIYHKVLASAGTVIMHGFLHHLSKEEIRNIFSLLEHTLPKSAHLVIFEPMRFESSFRLARKIAYFPLRIYSLFRFKFIKPNLVESQIRKKIESRAWGIPPRGVSPKEIPFVPGEMESYLRNRFDISKQDFCLIFSQLYTTELLLLALTSPVAAKALYYPVILLAILIERVFIFLRFWSPDMWVFSLWQCTKRN
jgi:SAM-dependent methyltransferase